MVIGVIAGILIANAMSTTLLKMVFAGFASLLGVKFLLKANHTITYQIHFHPLAAFIISLCVGTASGILGLGGGVILIPILLLTGLRCHK